MGHTVQTKPKADRLLVSNVQPNAGEILGRFADMQPEEAAKEARNELWVKAGERGMTLTSYLEEVDPSHRYNDGLDSFERQLQIANIRTRSDHSKGIYADTVDRFYLSDQPASPVLFPEFINRSIRTYLITPPILEDLIAITTPIDSSSYRTIYLQDTTTTRRMSRIAEGADLPAVKVLTSEKAITLHKYGMKLIGTYEAFRRMRIDMFALHLARVALQTQLDKSSEALDTGINGDGNSNAATNFNLTTLDSSTTAGHLTYYAWLRWNLKLYPYPLTTVVAGEAELLSILTLQFPNINPMWLLALLQRDGSVDMKMELTPGLFSAMKLVYFPLAPANVLFGINQPSALEMVTEIGSTLTETDRIISKQWNEITISEVVGFAQIIPQAIQTLTLNA